MLADAERVLRRIGEEYVDAGYPGIYALGFEPADPREVPVFGLLRAKGFVVPYTAAHWRLTDEGEEWILHNITPKED